MALNGNWKDKVDNVDYVLAKDINNIAHAVIDLENNIGIPRLKIGADDNIWYVSYNNGATWSSLGVKATGADGKTPVKGVDYYTAADKAEIVNDVLSALPTWVGGTY